MKKKYLLALLAGLLCLLCLLCAEASASEEEHKGHSTIYYYNYSAKSHQLYCTTCQKIVSFGFCSGASATCTETGYCETCLNPYRLPTGHKMTNYESDNNATCTQDGTKTARCQNDGCGESKTIPDEGSKLGHNFINYTPNGDANCTSVGTRTATCSRCTATDTQPGEGVAPNHNVISDPATPPTCTRDGLTAGNHCSRCQEVLTAQNTVARLGHQRVEDAAVAATCTRDGLTAGSHCGRCQEVLTAQNSVSSLGHWYTEWTPNGNGTHGAACLRDDCEYTGSVACLQVQAGTITFCPICGEASDGVHLPLVEGARVQANRMPAGELVVHQREGLTSICFVRSGKLSRPYAPATILLPNGESVLFDFVKAALPVLVIK